MCHIGTSQGIQVMRNFPKLPSTLFATGMAALLLGNLALANTAQAIELSSDNPSLNDTLTATHTSYGKTVLVRTNLEVSELEKLPGIVKTNTAEIDNLKKTVSEQARLIEELRRNTGTNVGSSTSEITTHKRTAEEQNKDLTRQLEELKRNNGSSSSSSSSEVSDLKRSVSEQQNGLKDIARQVDDLKRNAGSSSSSSSSDLSSVKQKVSEQGNQLDQLKRSVEDLSRKVK